MKEEFNKPGRKKGRDTKPTDFDDVFEDKGLALGVVLFHTIQYNFIVPVGKFVWQQIRTPQT